MTVLPQLERELVAAHRRRRRRRRRLTWPSVALSGGRLVLVAGVVIAAAVTAVALVALHATPPTPLRTGHHPTDPVIGQQGPRVLFRGASFGAYVQAYATGGRLYVAVRGPSGQGELTLIDKRHGEALRIRRFRRPVYDVVIARGRLWVTTTAADLGHSAPITLWRLDPMTLAGSRTDLAAGAGRDDSVAGSMAVAGGWLWVGNADALNRISLSTGRLSATVPVPGGEGVDVAANATGTVLIDSEGHETAHLERRDPATGALRASSPPRSATTKPIIGGIYRRILWISTAGGMMGSVSPLSAVNFVALPQPRALFNATNGIRAYVIDGILWITQLAGGPQRNYCGDPATGLSRAPLGLPSDAVFLTADSRYFYYANVGKPRLQVVVRAPIDPRCR